MDITKNWILNRAGILDYWYYDEEYFDFCDGRMLLRGQNGAGKSVTMQSFIPLLLDGKRSPERLDPFNSKARKLEDYLLGEYEVNRKESGTGYLFLELKRDGEDLYASIGMGMKAKRAQGITELWYFILNDGRRIGHDIFLYEGLESSRTALSKRKLENIIGDGGKVLTSQQDYASEVNKLFFGYESVEDFEEMVDLIVKIRTPKLSRDLNPSKIYDIMQSSLPGLSEEDLRPLSETIENLDSYQTKLNSMKDTFAAATSLSREYDRYNRYMAYEKMKSFLDTKDLFLSKSKEVKKYEKELQKSGEELEALTVNIESLKDEEKAVKAKLDQLKDKEEYQLSQKLAGKKQDLNELKSRQSQKDDEKYRKNSDLNKQLSEKKDLEGDIYKLEKAMGDYVDEASEICKSVGLNYHQDLLKASMENGKDLTLLKNQSKDYRRCIKTTLDKLEKAKELGKIHDSMEMRRDSLLKNKESITHQIEQVELQIEENKNTLKENISIYNRNNVFYKLSRDEEISLFQKINNINGAGGKNSLIEFLFGIKSRIMEGLNVRRASTKAEIEELNKKAKDIRREIEEIRSREDILYPTDELKLKAREKLSELNVPHIPFYMAAEFKPGIDDEMKAVMEQGLLDLGILDSLIVPLRYRDALHKLGPLVKDSIIFSSPQIMAQNLESYLAPGESDVPGISRQDVADAIASISLNPGKSAAYLCEDGTFGMGILKGKTSSLRPSKFIGIESRRKYREQLIRELSETLGIIGDDISRKAGEIRRIDDDIECLNKEYGLFPALDDLDGAYELYSECNENLRTILNDINKVDSEIANIQGQMAVLRTEISSVSRGVNLILRVEVFQEAYEEMDRYLEILDDMEKTLASRDNKRELLNKTQTAIERLEYDLELINDELCGILNKIAEHMWIIDGIEEALKNKGVDEIKREIEAHTIRLSEIPPILEKLNSDKENIIKANSRYSVELEQRVQEVSKLQEGTEAALCMMDDELSLGFVVDYNIINDDVEGFARSKVIEYGQYFKGDINQRENMNYRLGEEEKKYHSSLIDYIPNLELKEYRPGNTRIFITFTVDSKAQSLYKLIDILKDNIAEFELLIQQEDRKLFEDTLANSIGGKISAKIRKAKKWIDNMNKIMKDMDTSSGLEFQLKWEAKSPEGEDELHTSDLVKLLEIDPRAIKDNDIKRITGHFKARIERARKYRDDGQDYSALHMIMKEILDYRQWYEFKLFYQKTGESRRELSNNAYDRFSGGEKALSMYVPLLASLCAKYSSSRIDAPRIIAMDEAFAGVDENNVENMFSLINSLNFNFIMNSQALWGDYKTVPSLSIYELIRDKNSSTVLKVKYKWTGKEKILEGIG